MDMKSEDVILWRSERQCYRVGGGDERSRESGVSLAFIGQEGRRDPQVGEGWTGWRPGTKLCLFGKGTWFLASRLFLQCGTQVHLQRRLSCDNHNQESVFVTFIFKFFLTFVWNFSFFFILWRVINDDEFILVRDDRLMNLGTNVNGFWFEYFSGIYFFVPCVVILKL
jgi:hypothetical protein